MTDSATPTTTGSVTSARPGRRKDIHAPPPTTARRPRLSVSLTSLPAAGGSRAATPRRSSLRRAARPRSRLSSCAVARSPPMRRDPSRRPSVAPRIRRAGPHGPRARQVLSRQQPRSPRPAGASGRLRVQRPRFSPVGIAGVRIASVTRLRLAGGPSSRPEDGSLCDPTRLAGLRSRTRQHRPGRPARASRASPGMRRGSTRRAGSSRSSPTPRSAARWHTSQHGIAPPRGVRRSTDRVPRADSRRRSRARVPATAALSTPGCRRQLPLARHRRAGAHRAFGMAAGTSRRSRRRAGLPLTRPLTRTSALIRGFPGRWPKPMAVASSRAVSRPGARDVCPGPGRPARPRTRRRRLSGLTRQRRPRRHRWPGRPLQLVRPVRLVRHHRPGRSRRSGRPTRLQRRSRPRVPPPSPAPPSLAPASLPRAPLPRPSRRLRLLPPRQPADPAPVPQRNLAVSGRDRRAAPPAGGSRAVLSGFWQAPALWPSWP